MPRLPFRLSLNKGAVDQTAAARFKANHVGDSETQVATNIQPLEYDSSKVYTQIGTALKSSDHAQKGLLRVAQLISASQEVKDLQEAAIAQRLAGIVSEIDDLEKVLVKFELGTTRQIAQVIASALENTRASLMWYSKFLKNHSEEDAEVYKPLASHLSGIVNELAVLRQAKLDDTVKMEEAYNQKKVGMVKKTNLTRPVIRKTWPDPAHATPGDFNVSLKDQIAQAQTVYADAKAQLQVDILGKEQSELKERK